MPLPLRRGLAIALVTIIFPATRSYSQTAADATPPSVRPATPDTRRLLEELTARSPTARLLVERLRQSDVIVYVRHRWFDTETFHGRIGLLSSAGPHRFLVIEVGCGRTRTEQLIILAHELQHAVEIAGAPSVSDAASLGALYRRIGEFMGASNGSQMYETRAAADTGRRVRRELFGDALGAASAGSPSTRLRH